MTISILVTGGAGFVGRAIVDTAKEKHPEWAITVVDLEKPLQPKTEIRYVIGDITNASEVHRIIDQIKPDVIVHTAGIVPELADRYQRRRRELVWNINVNGTKNILDAAKRNGVEAVVWTGSCTAVTDDMRYQYPNIDETCPTSSHSLIYGESKAAAEALVLEANDEKLATCSIRPSVVFGPGDRQLVPSVHACIAKGETPFVLGDAENLWDVTYVENIAVAHVLAVENMLSSKTAAGEAFFISNESPIAFRDFCLAVWREFGHYPPFEVQLPEALAASVGYLAEWITWLTGAQTTISSASVKDACSIRYCTGQKAREILGYKPVVGLEEGIRISCAEYAERLKARVEVSKLSSARFEAFPISSNTLKGLRAQINVVYNTIKKYL